MFPFCNMRIGAIAAFALFSPVFAHAAADPAIPALASGSPAPSFLMLMGDDIGWADFANSGGIAHAPRLAAWLNTSGTLKLMDMHSGGTVCSPTRATVLTGRNHFRDCVNYVYDCSDMTECTPDMDFAPQRTFTIADAARAASKPGAMYTSAHFAKWHLGALYNDSEKYGGITSSPATHGFDFFQSTVEVAPTATTNCQCNASWQGQCDFGHNVPTEHCTGGPGPDPNAAPGCCFNYWKPDVARAHGVVNLTIPTPDDDAAFNAEAFVSFLETLSGQPFVAQVSFHNCHIPFVGTPARKAACNSSAECAPVLPGAAAYNPQVRLSCSAGHRAHSSSCHCAQQPSSIPNISLSFPAPHLLT